MASMNFSECRFVTHDYLVFFLTMINIFSRNIQDLSDAAFVKDAQIFVD